ncbi:MAG: insulinase family protein [Rhizobiales bacterium]|nr:insulinase family protein [Hyphomicrobiales bacterium]
MAVEVSRLSNGLTIVTDSMPHLQTTSVGVWVETGARHEDESINGISHMLEHMAFKGTQRRSARDIAEEIETVGGHLNAHTTHEATAYHARVLMGDLPLAVDIIADILQNSAFDAEELERERGVIVQEIGQAQDTPDEMVFDYLMGAAFPGQALGRPILGTVETVASFGRAQLRDYMQERYLASGMVLAAAGGVDHQALVALAQDRFGNLATAENKTHEPTRFIGGEHRDDRELEQVHLTLAFEGPRYSDPDFHTAQVFAGVLGGGMSSRLFQEVRENLGLCYSVFAYSWSFADTGMFGVYAGTSPDDVAALVPVLAREIKRLGEDATEAETARARAQIKAGLMMGLESSSARAEQIARQYMIHGRVVPVEEIVAHIEAVDAEAIRRFARRIVANAPHMALAAVGPLSGANGGLESYEAIVAKFA